MKGNIGRLLAAFSGSGKKGSEERGSRRHGDNENDSPLVPKRLLTPGAPPSSARGRRAELGELTGTGTVRA